MSRVGRVKALHQLREVKDNPALEWKQTDIPCHNDSAAHRASSTALRLRAGKGMRGWMGCRIKLLNDILKKVKAPYHQQTPSKPILEKNNHPTVSP